MYKYKLSGPLADVFNLMTSPCPPWISAEERAFLEKQDYHQVRRFHDISKADFEEQIDKGEPFILTEAMRCMFNILLHELHKQAPKREI